MPKTAATPRYRHVPNRSQTLPVNATYVCVLRVGRERVAVAPPSEASKFRVDAGTCGVAAAAVWV